MPRSDKRGAGYVVPHVFAVVPQYETETDMHLQSSSCTHRQVRFRLGFCSEMFGIMVSSN